MNSKLIIAILALLVFGLGVLAYLVSNNDITPIVTDFQSCTEAGYPVAESYPRQCYTPDGQRFVEQISMDEETQIPEEDIITACTMDAKLCPDGSSVGRIPPSCEFAPCPGE